MATSWKLWLCGGLVRVLLALLSVGAGAGEPRRQWFERSVVAVPATLTFSLAVTLSRYFGQTFAGEEPLAFLDGVSTWPGGFLRCYPCILLTLLIVARWGLKGCSRRGAETQGISSADAQR